MVDPCLVRVCAQWGIGFVRSVLSDIDCLQCLTSKRKALAYLYALLIELVSLNHCEGVLWVIFIWPSFVLCMKRLFTTCLVNIILMVLENTQNPLRSKNQIQ